MVLNTNLSSKKRGDVMIYSFNPIKPVDEIMEILNKHNIPISGIITVFRIVEEKARCTAIVPLPENKQELPDQV